MMRYWFKYRQLGKVDSSIVVCAEDELLARRMARDALLVQCLGGVVDTEAPQCTRDGAFWWVDAGLQLSAGTVR